GAGRSGLALCRVAAAGGQGLSGRHADRPDAGDAGQSQRRRSLDSPRAGWVPPLDDVDARVGGGAQAGGGVPGKGACEVLGARDEGRGGFWVLSENDDGSNSRTRRRQVVPRRGGRRGG